MATSKTNKAPKIDDDFLKGIKNADDTTSKTRQGENKTVTPATATNEKKTLITAKVNESSLMAWKQFCIDHDTTLTDTIKRAMNHYIKNVNNGNIEL